MPPGDPGKGIGHFLKELALDLAPVTGEVRSGLAAKKDFKEGRYGWAALNALGAIPLLGMAGRGLKLARGSDIVAKAISKLDVEKELAKTIKAANMLPNEEAVARRALKSGEQLIVPKLFSREVERTAVATRNPLPKAPMVEHVVSRMEELGGLSPEQAAAARSYVAPSVIKDTQFHSTRGSLFPGDALPGGNPDFDEFKFTRDVGYHVGTPGQAAGRVQQSNPSVFEALHRAYQQKYSGELYPSNEALEAFAATDPAGQAIIRDMGDLFTYKQDARVMGPLVVQAKRPLIAADAGNWNPEEIYRDLYSRGYPERLGVTDRRWGQEVDEALFNMENNRDRSSKEVFWDFLSDLGKGKFTTQPSDLPVGQPFDAIQYLNIAEDLGHRPPGFAGQLTSGWSYIVPKSQQIKSLLGHQGLFDPKNANIFRVAAPVAGAGLLSAAMLKNRDDDGN